MKKILRFSIPLMLLVFAACSSSKIISTWNVNETGSDSSHVSFPVHFKKILVLGVFASKDRATHEGLEDGLVQELQNASFNSVASISQNGPQAFENLNKQDALNKITDSTIDGIITIELIDQTKQFAQRPRYYNPVGGWGYRPWGYGYRPYGGYGGGRYYQTPSLVFETDLYMVNGKKLIYSGQSQVDANSNTGSMGKDYAKGILKDMRENNILN